MPDDPQPSDWDDLASLLGPGSLADLFSQPVIPPAGWEPVFGLDGVLMVAPEAVGIEASSAQDITVLGPKDSPAMLELAAQTRPGPFWPRTGELGTYLGIHEEGRLVAMAGERLQPPGWSEISAVCTAADRRGRGYAGLLVRALARRITADGRRAFLHVASANAPAIALYERLGFRTHCDVRFTGFRVPGS